MGWGTFIAGRTLSAWNREKRNQKSIGEEIEEHREMRRQREILVETEVLREIKRLQSEDKDVDVNAVRETIRNRMKTYNRLGSKLELLIIKELQQRTLAGEEVSYEQIEREILDAPPKNILEELTENNFSKVLLLQESRKKDLLNRKQFEQQQKVSTLKSIAQRDDEVLLEKKVSLEIMRNTFKDKKLLVNKGQIQHEKTKTVLTSIHTPKKHAHILKNKHTNNT
jgi:hypothetical protein